MNDLPDTTLLLDFANGRDGAVTVDRLFEDGETPDTCDVVTFARACWATANSSAGRPMRW